jgi:hypothetical protein
VRYAAAVVAVALALVAAGTTRAADQPVDNPALTSDVTSAFQELDGDVASLIACRGCQDGATPVEDDSANWEKTLNKLPAMSGAAYDAYRNAFQAVRAYGIFAIDYADDYVDAQAGETNTASNEFALVTAELKLARSYGAHAAVALHLRRYP